MKYDDVKVIPLNGEKCLQVQIGNLLFLDSYQFLSSSLDSLVSTLLKFGKENFHHTARYLGNYDFLFQKGVFCYNYLTDRSKFADTTLPPKQEFYNQLIDEAISDTDYDRAHRIWNTFDMKNLEQYHNFYLTADVLLLTDVFVNFRATMLHDHGLDCLHFPSLPSMTFQMALKMTGAELELMCDPDIYLMVESGIRGGISCVSQRYARANDPTLSNHDPHEPNSYLTYLDCNSLYATCQLQPLPVDQFRFLTQSEMEAFDLFSVGAYDDYGYILEVDLRYPENLHEAHNEYPMAPEHLQITEDMLSPTIRRLLEQTKTEWKPTVKLCPNLYNKTSYVTHYRNLQFYVNHGLQITRIHRIISFRQKPFMQPFIEYCNDRRKTASSDFESEMYKLFANAFFRQDCREYTQSCQHSTYCRPPEIVESNGQGGFPAK